MLGMVCLLNKLKLVGKMKRGNKICLFVDIVKRYHTCVIILQNGKVKCWGENALSSSNNRFNNELTIAITTGVGS